MDNTTQTRSQAVIDFAAWLCKKRESRGEIARVLAHKIWLSHAKYAEVELGIVKWIVGVQESLIPMALGLNESEQIEFKEKLNAARSAKKLCFSDIFSNDELKPVRACHHEGKQITESDERRLLNAVFAPLS